MMRAWFQQFNTCVRHELRQLVTQPSVYIFLMFAWLAQNLLTFFIGDLFGRNQADLLPFFALQPWVLLFLAPALAMSSWADEWRRGTAERLLTLPVHPLLLTLAKFKALTLILLVMQLGTLPLVATLAWLGNPDWGPLLSGYLGSLLCGMLFLSISLLASQWVRTAAGAFALAVVLNFLLLALGWPLLLGVLEGVLPRVVLDAFLHLSVLERVRQLSFGLIYFADVLFFVGLTAICLLGTHLILQLKRGITRALLPVMAGMLIPLVALVGAQFTAFKQDVTAEGLHTLHPSTHAFLADLEQDVHLTLYFSHAQPGIPVAQQHFYRQVQDFLQTISRLSPRLTFTAANTDADLATAAAALKHDLVELPLPNGEGYYFGLLAQSGGRETQIPFLEASRQSFLEFDVVSLLTEIQKTKISKIGILTELNLGDHRETPRFVQQLQSLYEVELLPPGKPEFPRDLDLVVVFVSPYFDLENLYALDQYLVQGGSVLLTLDPFLRSVGEARDLHAPDRNADSFALDHPADLLRAWGVHYDYKQVVGDKSRAVPVELPGMGLTTYPLWLVLDQSNILQQHPITAGVERMLLTESGHFQRKQIPAGLKYEPLLQTSSHAQIVDRLKFDEYAPQTIGAELAGAEQVRDLAVMLSGTFNSVFQEVPAAVVQYYQDFATTPEAAVIPPLVRQTEQAGALVVLGDLDFIGDVYAIEKTQQFGQSIQRPANDNLAFFYNALQYLLGDNILLPLRGKAVSNRPLVRIESLLQEAQRQFQSLEQELVAELFQVTQRLQDLSTRAERRQFNEAQLGEELQAFRLRQLDIKQRLRDVRRSLREDMEQLRFALMLLNLLIAPVALSLWAAVFFWRRRRAHLRGNPSQR